MCLYSYIADVFLMMDGRSLPIYSLSSLSTYIIDIETHSYIAQGPVKFIYIYRARDHTQRKWIATISRDLFMSSRYLGDPHIQHTHTIQ